MKRIASKDKLIVALDVASKKEAQSLLSELTPEVKIFKIGPYLYSRYGPDIVKLVHKYRAKVFLDLKLHDIPATVANTMKQLVGLRVFMLTLHAQGGLDMMQAARQQADKSAGELKTKAPHILAVTVLSSFNKSDLRQIGVDKNINEQVYKLTRLAKQAKLSGVVLSAKELRRAGKLLGDDFIAVCPGIRPKAASKDDQKRTATPKEAIDNGASFIVVVRPVIKAKNPQKAALGIIKDIRGE